MNVEIFSVYDAAAKRYMDPFCAPTIEFAIRGFRQACETEKHQFAEFPEDYVLYHVGSFDAELGAVGPVVITKIAMATSWVSRDSLVTPELRIDELTANDREIEA